MIWAALPIKHSCGWIGDATVSDAILDGPQRRLLAVTARPGRERSTSADPVIFPTQRVNCSIGSKTTAAQRHASIDAVAIVIMPEGVSGPLRRE